VVWRLLLKNMSAQASLIVCDDIRFEITGKAIIVGMYTSDIVIPAPEYTIPQLFFLYFYECPIEERPTRIAIQLTLPGQPPILWQASPAIESVAIPEGRRGFIYRQIVPALGAVLRPGRIEARITTDRGDIDVRAPWIVQGQPMPVPNPSLEPTA
jgi:hypothetical protein